MTYCSGGKMWCLPYELLNHELEDVIGKLWINFTFDNGAMIVLEMLERCERELEDRRFLRSSRNLGVWSRSAWPRKGTPVIQYDFNTDEATAIVFDWSTVDIINRERENIQRD